MKTFVACLVLGFAVSVTLARADDHPDMAMHGMIVFGDGPIYMDHVVNVAPHNWQVLLEVQLDPATLKTYLQDRKDHPELTLKFRSTPIDLKDIPQTKTMTGDLFEIDGNDLAPNAQVQILKVLIHRELPL